MQHLSYLTKFLIGCLSLSIGLTLLFLKLWMFESIASSILSLKPNSLIKNLWSDPTDVLPASVYFFNWTNPESFRNLSTKPKLQEVGPYKYLQLIKKRNVVWNDNNTVTYNLVRHLFFDEEGTKLNMSEKITIMNVFAMSAAHYIRYWNYFVKRAVSFVFTANSYDLHYTKTVDEFLNVGFEDPLFDLGRYLPFIESHAPRFKKLALANLRNGSEAFEGVFNMADGVDGNFDIQNWNYRNIKPEQEGTCRKLRGSFGELYTRPGTKDHIEIFVPDICRSTRADFEEEVMVDGIKGLKYAILKDSLDNGTRIPENKCYCNGDCVASGVVNVSSCQFGMPLFASLPHFYNADPVYLAAFEGLSSDKSKHESYIILEPITRVLLKAVVRIQVNIFVHPVESISLFEDVPKIFFPIMWIEQKADLPDYVKWYLKLYLMVPNIIIGLSIIFISAGLSVLASVIFRLKSTNSYERVNVENTNFSVKSEQVSLEQDVDIVKV